MRSIFLAIAALGLALIPQAGFAQGQPTDAQLSRSFRDSFLKGCKSGKTPNVSNQSAYCTCMANGYQARYDGRTLTAISQAAGSLGQKGPALVNLMMQPEGKRCVAGS